MKIYIAAATILEIEPLLDSSFLREHKLVITGIGGISTAYQLSKVIAAERPDLIIQAGIAGAFNEALQLGSVVVVERDRIADLGVMENNQWKDVFDLGLTRSDEEPFDNGWLKNESNIIKRSGLQTVNAITINEITTAASRISELKSKYNPSIESMEGAALHYVCLQEKIEFLQLRAISNYIGERDKSKWKMKLAIKNLNDALTDLIEKTKSVLA